MPSDTDAGVIFGAENLADAGCGAAERFNLCRDRLEPRWNRGVLFETAPRIVVAKPERGDPALAFVLTELERLQWQLRNQRDQLLLDFRGNEIGHVTQALG